MSEAERLALQNTRAKFSRTRPEYWMINAMMIDHPAFADASRRYAEKLRRG